jgi:hypothetical protein
MIINEQAIRKREERIAARRALTRNILSLRYMDIERIQTALRSLNVRVGGLANRLSKGRSLTPTQWYAIT